MRERLFTPLHMTTAGFGAAGRSAAPDAITAPWGHVRQLGKLVPIQPGPTADNPPAIGPAGTVHCSVLDFARYAAFHLGKGTEGELKLRPETFRRLHTPAAGQEYAYGWIIVDRPWAKGRAYTHTGSNTKNMATVWIAPNVGFALVVMTNLGGDDAAKACDEVARALIAACLK